MAVSIKDLRYRTKQVLQGLRRGERPVIVLICLHRSVLATGNQKHFRFIPGIQIRTFVP